MSNYASPLKDIKIASPCSASWAEMYGNERQRFCSDCKLNVYNLSGMTTDEAERLILNAEGRLCVKFYRRADGSIITQNCPVGWAQVKKRVSHILTAAFSLIVSFTGGLWAINLFTSKPKVMLMGEMVVPHKKPSPLSTPEIPDQMVMGNISITNRSTKTPK